MISGPNSEQQQLASGQVGQAQTFLVDWGTCQFGDDLSFEQQQLNPQPGSGKPWWPALLGRLFCISEISRLTSKQEQLSPSQAGQAVKLAWCRLVPAHIRGTPLHSALPLHDNHIIVEELCLAAEPPNLSCASTHDYQPQAHTCTQQRPPDKPTSQAVTTAVTPATTSHRSMLAGVQFAHAGLALDCHTCLCPLATSPHCRLWEPPPAVYTSAPQGCCSSTSHADCMTLLHQARLDGAGPSTSRRTTTQQAHSKFGTTLNEALAARASPHLRRRAPYGAQVLAPAAPEESRQVPPPLPRHRAESTGPASARPRSLPQT